MLNNSFSVPGAGKLIQKRRKIAFRGSEFDAFKEIHFLRRPNPRQNWSTQSTTPPLFCYQLWATSWPRRCLWAM